MLPRTNLWLQSEWLLFDEEEKLKWRRLTGGKRVLYRLISGLFLGVCESLRREFFRFLNPFHLILSLHSSISSHTTAIISRQGITQPFVLKKTETLGLPADSCCTVPQNYTIHTLNLLNFLESPLKCLLYEIQYSVTGSKSNFSRRCTFQSVLQPK